MDGDDCNRVQRLNFWRAPGAIPLLLCLGLIVAPLAAGQSFFPHALFQPDNPGADAFKAKWYTEQLKALGEPSLFEAKQDSSVQTYRFLWLRSFHRPVAVRVQMHADGSATVLTKMANGAGGYKPGRLFVDKTELAPGDKVKKLTDKIQSLRYWSLPERDPKRQGTDGAQWIIEGVDHGSYRLVDRWSPDNGPVRELGLYFLHQLSGLDLKKEPIY
jgi:hypothetical protein